MASTFSELQVSLRETLNEDTASFWSTTEIHDILVKGARDLWRDIVDLKQEHYLRINSTDVYLPSGASQLANVPEDLHKVYLIEPRDVSSTGGFQQVMFTPREYNHDEFRAARASGTANSPYGEFFYAITGLGSPTGDPPKILIAPTTDADLNVTLAYIANLGPLYAESLVPIPGEADNALIAWGMAYARAKEREDRMPDPGWLTIYKTEKEHLLQSLGLRQYQEPTIVDGMFQALW